MIFCHLLLFFFPKNSFRNIISLSNSLDPDQDRHFVRLDLGPNCLIWLSADVTNKESVKVLNLLYVVAI